MRVFWLAGCMILSGCGGSRTDDNVTTTTIVENNNIGDLKTYLKCDLTATATNDSRKLATYSEYFRIDLQNNMIDHMFDSTKVWKPVDVRKIDDNWFSYKDDPTTYFINRNDGRFSTGNVPRWIAGEFAYVNGFCEKIAEPSVERKF